MLYVSGGKTACCQPAPSAVSTLQLALLPGLAPGDSLTWGKNWALGLVGQAMEGLFIAGEPCPPFKGPIFSSKLQPGLVAFPLDLRSLHT